MDFMDCMNVCVVPLRGLDPEEKSAQVSSMARKLQTASQAELPPELPHLFEDGLVAQRTHFSPTRTHRYTLYRHWGSGSAYCVFIGMNPSGADVLHDDRTVAKCARLAKRWGYDQFYMLNTFALRATNPEELAQASDPVGPENDRYIREVAGDADLVVVAWGKPARLRDRDREVTALLREVCDPSRVKCFALNQDGTAKHPLYVKEDSALIPFPLVR